MTSDPRLPDFSIIVPVGPQRDPLVLGSLQPTSHPGHTHEVLVGRGPNASRNRNHCARRARAAVLAFTDDDCVVSPDWLARAAAFFRAHPEYDAVGGPQLNLDDEHACGRAIGYALGSRFGSLRTYRRFRRAPIKLDATQLDLTSANLFVTRRAFDRWGPFDERLWPNEETALLHRIERGGGKIAYDPAIVVGHRRRPSLRSLGAQCFGYGRGRARQTRIEQSVVPAATHSFPCLVLLYFALSPLALWWPGLALPLLAYALGGVAIAVATAARERDAAALLMPAVFPVIHTTYPAGLLFESMRNAFRPSNHRRPGAFEARPGAWSGVVPPRRLRR